MARPTKLNAAVQSEIVNALEDGAYIETAAEAAGISVTTLYNWLDRGASEERGPFVAFLEAVTRARAKAELDLLRRIRQGDTKDYSFGPARAATFVLERTRPDKYAQRINAKVEGAVSEVLEVVRGICSPQDFARILERLSRVDREGGERLPEDGSPGDSLH